MVASHWSRWITLAAVLLLAVIAAVVSYAHMFELALGHGEPAWRAGLFPLSVDGMIVAASMSLLSDAGQGRRGGVLPWTLLIVGSAASLAANVAVADPTVWSRVIHAWPAFALIGSYELLMRQFRANAACVRRPGMTRPTRITLWTRHRVPRTLPVQRNGPHCGWFRRRGPLRWRRSLSPSPRRLRRPRFSAMPGSGRWLIAAMMAPCPPVRNWPNSSAVNPGGADLSNRGANRGS
ncbi:uncharacterized protein DUF2637 [Haloactinospora alba]|uniref:Uncharacterized protein DUF2637 n=1 Tax=Haloactinospora alba TaxID=405555 RepID=A0A543NLM1_9ACTN|nr:DUF2637 domain-containing protein [Haloactinospora alba]TQN32697.1 uncharacterized protein DUF2637 [Haloactinospora alba]